MKKTTRNLLIMLAVLVVLGGAAAALLLMSPGTEPEGSSSSAPSSAATTAIMDREAADVKAVTVENALGTMRFVQKTTEEDGKSKVDFVLEGYEKYDMDASAMTAAVKSLLSLNATKDLGEQESLADFGLTGETAVTAELEYTDGGKDTLVVGNKGGESAGRYILKDGKVYIAGGVNDSLQGDVYGYFNTAVYSIEDLTKDVEDEEGNITQEQIADQLDWLTLSGSQFPKTIKIEHDSTKTSGYLITEPVISEAGTTPFNNMMTALKSLSADSVAAAGVDGDALEEYGLKEPFAKVEFRLNRVEHTLAVSEADSDGNRYLVADGGDVVYKVTGDSVSTWAEATLMTLRMPYIWLPNIKEVKTLTLTLDGETYAFTTERTKNEERSTEDSIYYDLTVQNADGKDVDYSTSYQPFYQNLIGVAVLSPDEAQYGGTPALKVEYGYFSGGSDDVIEFYPVGEDRYAAVLNGQYNGLVRRTDVDKLISLVPTLNEGGEIQKPN